MFLFRIFSFKKICKGFPLSLTCGFGRQPASCANGTPPPHTITTKKMQADNHRQLWTTAANANAGYIEKSANKL